MEQAYPLLPSQFERSGSSAKPEEQGGDSSSSPVAQASQAVGKAAEGAPGKILSTGGLLMATLLSLLLGLAYVVRSLKNVKLMLKLTLKRDDRAEKKY